MRLTCTSACIHVSSNVWCVVVWCVVLCCKFNATGNLLGSDPGALGHCKSFTLPWRSRHTARSHALWHANTWKLRVISNMCFSDMPRGGLTHYQLVVCRRRGRKSGGGKLREAEKQPVCASAKQVTETTVCPHRWGNAHPRLLTTTTQPCLIPQHLMPVFRQRAVRLIFRNISTLPADPSRSLRFKGNKCKI